MSWEKIPTVCKCAKAGRMDFVRYATFGRICGSDKFQHFSNKNFPHPINSIPMAPTKSVNFHGFMYLARCLKAFPAPCSLYALASAGGIWCLLMHTQP